jgi:hypothetical protein
MNTRHLLPLLLVWLVLVGSPSAAAGQAVVFGQDTLFHRAG